MFLQAYSNELCKVNAVDLNSSSSKIKLGNLSSTPINDNNENIVEISIMSTMIKGIAACKFYHASET